MRLKPSGEGKALLAYLSVCIVWGSTYLAIRIGVSDFPPELFAGIRFSIAGLLMLFFALMRHAQMPNLKTLLNVSVMGLFLILGGNGMVVWAEQWVDSGMAALLLATVPLWMALIELILPGRKPLGLKGWGGLMIGFGGVTLLILSGGKTGSIDLAGGLWILAAAVSWAIGSVYSSRVRLQGSIVAIIGIEMLAGGLGQVIVGLSLGEAQLMHFSTKGIGAMVYLIFIGSIVGYSSYIYLLQKWPAAKASTYAYVNPVVAIFLGALILGEPVTGGIVLASGVILGGVLLVQLGKSPKQEKEKDNQTIEQTIYAEEASK